MFPYPVLLEICSYLDTNSILNFIQINQYLYNLKNYNTLWQYIYTNKYIIETDHVYPGNNYFEKYLFRKKTNIENKQIIINKIINHYNRIKKSFFINFVLLRLICIDLFGCMNGCMSQNDFIELFSDRTSLEEFNIQKLQTKIIVEWKYKSN